MGQFHPGKLIGFLVISGNFKCIYLQHILLIDSLGISNEYALKWISQYPTDEKSTLVYLMA